MAQLTSVDMKYFISGRSQEDVDDAERLCKDLVATVKAEYERWKSRPPQPEYERRPYGGRSVSTKTPQKYSSIKDRTNALNLDY